MTAPEERPAADRSEGRIRALGSLHRVAEEDGLANLKKPCVAYVLDGNTSEPDFTIVLRT